MSSLSLVAVVRDAEAELADLVHSLLELGSELTGQLELLVVDDGSLDDTISIARELARIYPQVRVIRNDMNYGRQVAIQFALRRAAGEYILITDGMPPASQVKRLWRLRGDREFVIAQSDAADTALDGPSNNGPNHEPYLLRRDKIARRLDRGHSTDLISNIAATSAELGIVNPQYSTHS